MWSATARERGDPTFEKSVGDAFSVAALHVHLQQRGVTHLDIVGLDGIACVQRTARGARQRGYHARIISEAVLTSYPDRWATMQPGLETQGIHVTGT